MNVLLEVPLSNSSEGAENQETYYYSNGTFYSNMLEAFSVKECLTNGSYSGFMGKTDDTPASTQEQAAQGLESLNTIELNVFPIPVEQVAQVRIEGNLPENITTHFRLYDLMGREVMQKRINSNRFSFDRQDLAAGWYFYQVEANGQLLNTGKIIMK